MSTYVLTSLSRIKDLTGIASTNYDTMISMIIPMVIDDIKNYTNNWFTVTDRKVSDSNYTFSTGKTITPTSTSYNFSEYFINGDIIHIYNSRFNDGYYSLATVTSTMLTVNENLNAESTNVTVIIHRIEFPKDLEFIAANMIKYQTDMRATNKGINSESLGDYSVNYGAGSGSMLNSYPDGILGQLNKYRKMRKI